MALQHRCRLIAVVVVLAGACASEPPPPRAAEPLSAQEREWLAQYAKNKNTDSVQPSFTPAPAPAARKSCPPNTAPVRSDAPVIARTKAPTAAPAIRDAVNAQVSSQLGTIQQCYEKELARDECLEGSVIVSWTILATGNVSNVLAVGGSLQSEPVRSCIEQAVSAMKFPKRKADKLGDVRVSYPFRFSSRGS